MENAACVLRNLSYRLENEVDPQEETGDVLDHDWEEEQRKDMDEITQPFSNSSPGCLAFLKRSRGNSRRERGRVHSPMVSRPSYSVDYANPGESGCTVHAWSTRSISLSIKFSAIILCCYSSDTVYLVQDPVLIN